MTNRRRRSSDTLPEGDRMVLPANVHLIRPVQNLRVSADPPADRPGTLGGFTGYACLWETPDTYGTVFVQGAFGRAGLDDKPYPFLWLHSPWDPIGAFMAQEDDTGLRVAGWWDDTPAGQQGRARALSGSAPELSVGFGQEAYEDPQETRIIACPLREVSQVTLRWASQPGAELAGVRAQGDPGALDRAAAAAKAALDLAVAPRASR